MRFNPPPGFISDSPWATPPGEATWVAGFNTRFRLGHLETIGLFGALQDISGNAIQVPLTGAEPIRTLFTSPYTGGIQILAGEANAVHLIEADIASTPATGTRYQLVNLSPSTLPVQTDALPNPDLGVVAIAKDWFFLADGDRIFGARADSPEEPWTWDRDPLTDFIQLAAGTPQLAVGGAVVDGILVLLACEAFDPQVSNRMTVRWSDRFNWEEWLPGPTTVSGEYQLSKGSRIMGGGGTSHGVIAWTDVAMYALNPTGETEQVFSLDEVSSSHGLLANHAWCEIEGVIYFLDQSRKLCRYSGGRVDVIINPLKLISLERVDSVSIPRIYLQPNVEYTEIAAWYPLAQTDEPNRALVYNYGSQQQREGWSIWALPRTAWFPRVGAQDIVAAAPDGTIYAQDLDVSLPIDNLEPASETQSVPAANNVEPFDWAAWTSLITAPDPSMQTHGYNRIAVSTLQSHAVGAEADEISLLLRAFENLKVTDRFQEESYMLTAAESMQSVRVEGRTLQLRFSGDQVKTVSRVGLIVLGAKEPERGKR